MKVQLFAIRDSALNAYMNIWQAPTIGAANRIFNDEVNNADSAMNKHPDDYELFHLGEFDQDDGTLKTPKLPTSVARAKDVIIK